MPPCAHEEECSLQSGKGLSAPFPPTQLPSPYLAQLPLGSDCVLIS